MTARLDHIFRKYGQAVTVNGTAARAFFQPARETEKAAPFAVTSLGTVDNRQWTYLGRTKAGLGDRVEFQGRTYTVRNCEEIRLRDEAVYWWAVLMERRKAAE